jgi:hypothetical protein
MTTPIRAAKQALADDRALAEQAEREVDTAGMPQKKMRGAGKKAAEMPCGDDEAVGYGRMLAAHISKLHGGAYHAAFMKGMSAYGNPDVPATPVAFSSNVPEKAKARVTRKAKKGGMRMVGAGELKMEIEHMGEGSESDEEMEGGMKGCGTGAGVLKIEHSGSGQTGRFEGEGRVDGRKARAAIVKKVMAEKGMKMVEASKYVKEHGLYKSGK